MKNDEELLTNYPFILKLIKVGVSIKQIANELERSFQIPVTYRELLYLIERVRTGKIHPEYNDIVVIDGIKDAWDTKLTNYCIDFHGLLITYRELAHLTNPEYIITPDNITTIYGRDSILYAKRLLKLYHISDKSLLAQHNLVSSHSPQIDLQNLTYKIRVELKDEVDRMLMDLRNKYVEFIKPL